MIRLIFISQNALYETSLDANYRKCSTNFVADCKCFADFWPLVAESDERSAPDRRARVRDSPGKILASTEKFRVGVNSHSSTVGDVKKRRN